VVLVSSAEDGQLRRRCPGLTWPPSTKLAMFGASLTVKGEGPDAKSSFKSRASPGNQVASQQQAKSPDAPGMG
jgi:hypothetical protein